MDEILVPGTTVVYPSSEYPAEESDFALVGKRIYQGYTSPPDELLLHVAYLVDPTLRKLMKERGIADLDKRRTPEYETFFAEMAQERLGISFGTEYKFPAGLNARRFQQYFMRCCSGDENMSEAERENLNRFFSVLKELNPAEFKKLEVLQLSEKDKVDVIMGVASKFTMEDIINFLQINRTGGKKEIISGAPFVISKATKEKLRDFLEKQGTSLAYFNDFIGYHNIPDQDLKIEGLSRHSDKEIVAEIRKNPNRFFKAVEKSSKPLHYAKWFLKGLFPDGIKGSRSGVSRIYRAVSDEELDSKDMRVIYEKLVQIKKREEGNPLRRGLVKVLDLVSDKLPPTQGRQTVKRALVKGYRFFYPKSGPDK